MVVVGVEVGVVVVVEVEVGVEVGVVVVVVVEVVVVVVMDKKYLAKVLVCCTCKQSKPRAEFYANRPQCKPCIRKSQNKWVPEVNPIVKTWLTRRWTNEQVQGR